MEGPPPPTGPAHVHSDSHIQGIDDEVAELTKLEPPRLGVRSVRFANEGLISGRSSPPHPGISARANAMERWEATRSQLAVTQLIARRKLARELKAKEDMSKERGPAFGAMEDAPLNDLDEKFARIEQFRKDVLDVNMRVLGTLTRYEEGLAALKRNEPNKKSVTMPVVDSAEQSTLFSIGRPAFHSLGLDFHFPRICFAIP